VISKRFVLPHTKQLIELMQGIAIDLPTSFRSRNQNSSNNMMSSSKGNSGGGSGSMINAEGSTTTEACLTFLRAMRLMSCNIMNSRVPNYRQEYLRILGHMVSHCKTLSALEAVVSVLRTWLLGARVAPILVPMPQSSTGGSSNSTSSQSNVNIMSQKKKNTLSELNTTAAANTTAPVGSTSTGHGQPSLAPPPAQQQPEQQQEQQQQQQQQQHEQQQQQQQQSPPVRELRVVGEFLSDGEKELFLIKLQQYIMRFRETPSAIPLMSSYLDIVYVLCCQSMTAGGNNHHHQQLHQQHHRSSIMNTAGSSFTSPQGGGGGGGGSLRGSNHKGAGRYVSPHRGRSVSFAKGQHSSSSSSSTSASAAKRRGTDGVSHAAPSRYRQRASSVSRRSVGLVHLLQQPFTSALMSPNPTQRAQFFTLFLINLRNRGKLSNATVRLQTAMEYDWEPVSSRFWISLASGCLMSGIADKAKITLGQNGPPPFSSFSHTDEMRQEWCNYVSGTRSGIGSGESNSSGSLPFAQNVLLSMQCDGTRRLMEEQRQFLESASGMKKYVNVVGSLLELSHADAGVATEMWIQIFPKYWNNFLDERAQTSLIDPLNRLLSQSYHRYQLQLPNGHGYRRNVVQTLLKAVSKCVRSTPLVPPELLTYLGRTFNAWHVVIDLLESRLWSVSGGSRTPTPEELHSITNGLALMYKDVGDEESRSGLRRMIATTPQTLQTLDLLAMRQYTQAQENIVHSLSRYDIVLVATSVL